MVDERVFAASDQGHRVSNLRLLFAVLGAPVLWSIHLGVCYFLLTLDCISGWNGAGWGMAVATVLAAAGSLAAGFSGWRIWRMFRSAHIPADEREWAPFLVLVGMAASGLFTLVIVAEGVAPYFVQTCS